MDCFLITDSISLLGIGLVQLSVLAFTLVKVVFSIGFVCFIYITKILAKLFMIPSYFHICKAFAMFSVLFLTWVIFTISVFFSLLLGTRQVFYFIQRNNFCPRWFFSIYICVFYFVNSAPFFVISFLLLSLALICCTFFTSWDRSLFSNLLFQYMHLGLKNYFWAQLWLLFTSLIIWDY